MNDPHLQATGGLAPITLPDGRPSQTVLMPITLGGKRLGVRMNPPKLGEHSAELLTELGFSAADIDALTVPVFGTETRPITGTDPLTK